MYGIKMGVKYWGGDYTDHWVTESWMMWPGSSIWLELCNISYFQDGNGYKYIDIPFRNCGDLVSAFNHTQYGGSTTTARIEIKCCTDDGTWPYLLIRVSNTETMRSQSVIFESTDHRREYRNRLIEASVSGAYDWTDWDIPRRNWVNNEGCIRRPNRFKQRNTNGAFGWNSATEVGTDPTVATYLDHPIDANGFVDWNNGECTMFSMLDYIEFGNKTSDQDANNINIYNSGYHGKENNWAGEVRSCSELMSWNFSDIMSIRYCPTGWFYNSSGYNPLTGGKQTNFPGWFSGIGGNPANLGSSINNWQWATGKPYHPYRKQYDTQIAWGVAASIFGTYASLSNQEGQGNYKQFWLPLMGAVSPFAISPIETALYQILDWKPYGYWSMGQDLSIFTTWGSREAYDYALQKYTIGDAHGDYESFNVDSFGSIGIRAVTCDANGDPVNYSGNESHIIDCVIVAPSLLSDWVACDIYGLKPRNGGTLPTAWPTIFKWHNGMNWRDPLTHIDDSHEGYETAWDKAGVLLYSTVAH